MTTMEPPESLLTQLDRIEPPAPWLVLAGGVGSLLTETCTISSLGGDHQTHLPLETPIRITPLESAGSSDAHVQVRIIPPCPEVSNSDTVVILTASGGPSHHLQMGADGLTIDDETAMTLGPSGWLDLGVSFSAGHAAGTVSYRRRLVRELKLGSAPVELTISHGARESDNPIASAAIRNLEVPETLDRADALTHVTALVDRLDEGLPQWRRSNGSVEVDRPLEVFAARREVRRNSTLPTGRLEVLGFLSEGWQMRMEAQEWSYVSRQGAPVDPDGLDAYGRAGGLIGYVYDRHWEMPPSASEDGTRDSLEPVGSELYSGHRAAWMTGMRNTETMLYQVATVWYLARQSGTASPEEATTTLHQALHQLWHPAYAFHLDVVQILARAIGRFRFSDLQYTERAPVVLAELRDRLAQQGIAARAVVLS